MDRCSGAMKSRERVPGGRAKHSSVEVPQPRLSLCNLYVMHQDISESVLEVDVIIPSSLHRFHVHKEDSQHLTIH